MKLLRRRHVWLPTVWGWLVLLLACGALALLAALHLYAFLALQQPAAGARLLVVEGWMPSPELDQALRVYREGGYERVVTTGGPIENEFEREGSETYAERARAYLVRHGLAADAVVAVPSPATARRRSYMNAVVVHEWAARSGVAIDALDVFSLGPHSRRSWLLNSRAFGPQVRIGVISATPTSYDPNAWWRTSAGTKEVLTEAIAWFWTELFLHPEPAGR